MTIVLIGLGALWVSPVVAFVVVVSRAVRADRREQARRRARRGYIIGGTSSGWRNV